MNARKQQHLTGDAEITRYGSFRSDGKANVQVSWPGVRLLINADSDDPDAAAAELARMPTRLAAANRELDALRACVPPEKPARIMNTGCVRQDPSDPHQLWLLSSREKGWSAFGFRLSGWDELFRHWHVTVVAVGSDQHGPYWTVENAHDSLKLEARK